MKLADLPQFKVSHTVLEEDGWVLEGQFNHLLTVHETRSWLLLPDEEYLLGDLEQLNAEDLTARYRTFDTDLPSEEILAAAHPWLDGWWQGRHIPLILNPQPWKRIRFAKSDALEVVVDGWRRTRCAVGVEPEPGEVRVPNGWDNESCMLCTDGIEPGDIAYRLADEFMCEDCYLRYAAPHDLSFVLPGHRRGGQLSRLGRLRARWTYGWGRNAK